uniref:UDP-glucuronosyltransferase n=1 Tax=Haemonchus contortus TaxID=6289 RepID=A0A7I4Y1X9_HAECO
MFFNVLIVILTGTWFVSSSNILVWSPSYGRSHIVIFGRIADILTADGHNVTILSPMLDPTITTFGNKLPAHTFHIKPDKEAAEHYLQLVMTGPALWTSPTCTGLCVQWSDYSFLVEQTFKLCKDLAYNDDLMHRLRESKFDLVFTEGLDTCGPQLFKVLGIKNAIIVSTLGMMPRLYDIAGLLPMPSFMPTGLTPFSDELTFVEKLINFNLHLFFEVFKWYLDGRFERMFNAKYPGLPSIRDNIYEQTALIATHVHEFAEVTHPTTNMIRYVGGFAINDPQPLSKELDDLLNKRPATILFCMGSLAQSSEMPDQLKKVFIETFTSLPNITFIWKYEESDHSLFKNTPNIYTMKWVPQTDLLADQRLSLFITHGGVNSMLESMNYGKPMIVMPLFADQLMNAKSIQRRGLGIIVEKHLLTKEILTAAIQQVLNDKSIARQCSLVKSLLKDRPRQYREDILKYTRAIIEYGRLEHLQMISRNMNVFQYLCLDVVLFELCIVLIVLFSSVWLLRRLLSRMRAPKTKNE